jgi:hypothetical protein
MFEATIAMTSYQLLGEKPLAKVYAPNGFDPGKPFMVISSHIDSIYKNYSFWFDKHNVGITSKKQLHEWLDKNVPVKRNGETC